MRNTTFLSRLVPGSLLGRILLFCLVPLILSLSTLWMALLFASPFTPYLCTFLLFGSIASVRYRTKGVITAFLFLFACALFFYGKLPFDQRLCQYALAFVATLNFLILYLCAEEIEEGVGALVEESKTRMNQYLAKNQELLESEQSWTEARERLEGELAKWKEEAEQRKIDMRASEAKMRLIQSEIEMLNAQKEDILDKAYAQREEANKQLLTLQEQMTEVEKAREGAHLHLAQESALKKELEEVRAALAEAQQGEAHAPEESRELAQVRGLYKQLRAQFEEKSKVLVHTRRDLFQIEGKLEACERDAQLTALGGERDEADYLESALTKTLEENRLLEEEVTLLEGLISRILDR